MNRVLMAAVITLAVVGCAVGVEDPQPSPGPDPVQKAPPAQTFSDEFDPITDTSKLNVGSSAPDLPPLLLEKPPKPGH